MSPELDRRSERLKAAMALFDAAFKKAVEACEIAKEELTRPLTPEDIKERDPEDSLCFNCNGTGEVEIFGRLHPCTFCGGRGKP